MLAANIEFRKNKELTTRSINIDNDGDEVYLPDLSTSDLIFLDNEIVDLKNTVENLIRGRFARNSDS